MNDPVSRLDNDAVLASIRRLVLSGQGERRDMNADAHDDTGQEIPPGPLVLTPDLRVDGGGEAAPDGATASAEAAPGRDGEAANAALDWQDAGTTATEATTGAHPPAADDDTATAMQDRRDATDLAEAVVDEDFLRDIVSEIVREELQGAMGERITRNVRKLVRRELNRALASRDID